MLDGSATGPKTIEIGNWSGKAVFSPRAMLKSMLTRPEFDSPGIYFLRSQSESYEFDESIYIGEAEELRARLKQHIADRDFESVVCFLSKDEMLTKAHIKYLESRLIALSREANSSFIENNNNPKGARLSEADVSDMEYFIEQIRLILPTVGMNSLVIAAPHATTSTESAACEATYKVKSKTLDATMVETEEGFVVKAGSQASPKTSKSIAEGWLKIRKKLVDAEVLQQEANQLVFTEDTIFSSPSAASSVILGRQAPGPISWVNANGQTYKEVQEGTSDT
ncbi:GIY-YIG nuclease family protein [Sulfurimonas sp. HSL-1656]|uniref:GIY-YIG nuclease family protein n=1 Tax=Thiomicrolovo subterrani TaxID=3131934 RepID=UPI0031F8DF9F